MVKILLATDFSNGFSRDLLKGVIRYIHNKPDWTLYRMPKYYKVLLAKLWCCLHLLLLLLMIKQNKK